jgi:hypothetical protein
MYIARGEFTPSKHDQWFKHLVTEFHAGDLNGPIAAGTHELPFSFKLPDDLVANATLANVVRKQVDDYRNVHVEVQYNVVAKLEVAGLSNKSLCQKQVFTIAPIPTAVPLGCLVRAEKTEQIKSLGFGKGEPCALRMEVAKDVADFRGGVISVDVEIELPLKRKPHQIKVVLYEDVFVDRGSQVKNGTRHVPRDICSKAFKPKHLTTVGGPSATTLRGTLQLTITDPDKEWFGAITPSIASHFLQIRHRVGVECVFLLGTTVKVSAAITLVDHTRS